MPIRITGLNSGMDTDSIVRELVSAHSIKKEKYVKQKTTLEWKQEKWKDLNAKFYNLLTKTLDSVRFSAAYKKKATTSSDPTKASVTANDSVNNGVQELKINQLAKAGYLTGANLKNQTGKTVSADSTLADLGYSGGNGSITVKSGGNTVNLTVTEDTKISDFVDQLKNAGLSANFDAANQRIFIGAKESGADNDFALIGTDAEGLAALSSFGVLTNSEANNELFSAWKDFAQYDGANVLDMTDTKANIRNILTEMEARKAANTNLNDEISDLNDKNTAINEANRYVQYRKGAQAIVDKINPGVDKDKLQELLAMSEEDLNQGTNRADLENLISNSGLTDDEIKGLKEANKAIVDYEMSATTPDEFKVMTDMNTIMSGPAADRDAAVSEYMDDLQAEYDGNKAEITNKQNQIAQNNAYLEENKLLEQSVDPALTMDEKVEVLYGKVANAVDVLANGITPSQGATRIDGQNAEIELNGAVFESNSNTINVNGLSITAMKETAPGETISLTTATDTQGIFDTVKGFFKEYNSLMKEMDKLFNASSSRGYEPLTSEEKEEMTEDEIEKWEAKIKDSLLRRDDTVSSLMTMMSSSMSKVYEVNGQKYSLASFGIMTSKYGEAAENERYLYHIDGDSEDTLSGNNANRLMEMIQQDPEAVEGFFKQLTEGLYTELNDRMKKSTELRSAYSIYNDKKMTEDIKQANKSITKWEEKLEYYENYYYDQFTAMETALAKLQSSTNSLSQLMGM